MNCYIGKLSSILIYQYKVCWQDHGILSQAGYDKVWEISLHYDLSIIGCLIILLLAIKRKLKWDFYPPEKQSITAK